MRQGKSASRPPVRQSRGHSSDSALLASPARRIHPATQPDLVPAPVDPSPRLSSSSSSLSLSSLSYSSSLFCPAFSRGRLLLLLQNGNSESPIRFTHGSSAPFGSTSKFALEDCSPSACPLAGDTPFTLLSDAHEVSRMQLTVVAVSSISLVDESVCALSPANVSACAISTAATGVVRDWQSAEKRPGRAVASASRYRQQLVSSSGKKYHRTQRVQ